MPRDDTLTDEDRAFLAGWDAERFARPAVPQKISRPERTGQRCIQCYQPEYAGQPIAHKPTCADYRRPVPASRSSDRLAERPGFRSVWATGTEAYAQLVSRLTERRRGRYDCPACGAPGDGHGVKVDLVDGAILVICFTCRAPREIVEAIGMTPIDLGWRRAA